MGGIGADTITTDVYDEAMNRKLNRILDWRVLPVCCWLYLLNFLDRGNIGNAKVLNAETGDDLLSQTGMNASGYAVTVSLFSVAYALFEVPSNWISQYPILGLLCSKRDQERIILTIYTVKHYVRPSLWLAILLGCWGALTIGFGEYA